MPDSTDGKPPMDYIGWTKPVMAVDEHRCLVTDGQGQQCRKGKAMPHHHAFDGDSEPPCYCGRPACEGCDKLAAADCNKTGDCPAKNAWHALDCLRLTLTDAELETNTFPPDAVLKLRRAMYEADAAPAPVPGEPELPCEHGILRAIVVCPVCDPQRQAEVEESARAHAARSQVGWTSPTEVVVDQPGGDQ